MKNSPAMPMAVAMTIPTMVAIAETLFQLRLLADMSLVYNVSHEPLAPPLEASAWSPSSAKTWCPRRTEAAIFASYVQTIRRFESFENQLPLARLLR
jgi:hypothetical protein